MGHPVGVAQDVLEGDVASERVTEHRPPFETEVVAKGIGIRGEVLPRHGFDRGARRAPVAAVVVEDQPEPIRATPEGQHRVQVGSGSAVHEHKGVAVSEGLDVERDVPDLHHRHGGILSTDAVTGRACRDPFERDRADPPFRRHVHRAAGLPPPLPAAQAQAAAVRGQRSNPSAVCT